MTDDLVPLPQEVRALPAPSVIGDALKRELSARVSAERAARGDVHIEEDVYPLVRALSSAHDLLGEYASQFAAAARVARAELDNELMVAAGEQDGVPQAALTVPDGSVNVRLAPAFGNTHNIDTDQVIDTVIALALDLSRGTEPEQGPEEEDPVYLARYEQWMAGVIRLAVNRVLELGSYSMQVSKVQTFSEQLAATGTDDLSAVVRGSVRTTRTYQGVKYERKRRKEKS